MLTKLHEELKALREGEKERELKEKDGNTEILSKLYDEIKALREQSKKIGQDITELVRVEEMMPHDASLPHGKHSEISSSIALSNQHTPAANFFSRQDPKSVFASIPSAQTSTLFLFGIPPPGVSPVNIFSFGRQKHDPKSGFSPKPSTSTSTPISFGDGTHPGPARSNKFSFGRQTQDLNSVSSSMASASTSNLFSFGDIAPSGSSSTNPFSGIRPNNAPTPAPANPFVSLANSGPSIPPPRQCSGQCNIFDPCKKCRGKT